MKMLRTTIALLLLTLSPFTLSDAISGAFEDNAEWRAAQSIKFESGALKAEGIGAEDASIFLYSGSGDNTILKAKGWRGDSVIQFEFMLGEGAVFDALTQGRYAVRLSDTAGQYELDTTVSGAIITGASGEGVKPGENAAKEAGQWQHVEIRFRSPRYSEAGAKTDNAFIVDVVVNGKSVQSNVLLENRSPNSIIEWEGTGGPFALDVKSGQIAIRNFAFQSANYDVLTLPEESGGKTNIDSLVDLSRDGKKFFQDVGCAQCHSNSKGDTAQKTGPNLFGLFQATPRERVVASGGEGHRFTINADDAYFFSSLRTPAHQLAIDETSADNKAYLPIMPAYNEQVISHLQASSLLAYLKTLNESWTKGPVVHLEDPGTSAAYDPLEDRFQFIVTDKTRIQRGPMLGVSGRAVHVGLTSGINYSFDPRFLGIAKIWQGGFLDMSGELQNRGGGGLKPGYQSQEISLNESQMLFAPLTDAGDVSSTVNFSFKEANYGDDETVARSLNSEKDHSEMLAAIDAQFLGYDLDSKSDGIPSFNYRIAKNTLSIATRFAADGKVRMTLSGAVQSKQAFYVNADVLNNIQVNSGTVEGNRWVLEPSNAEINVELTADIAVADAAWGVQESDFAFDAQKLKLEKSEANMPAGYSIESYFPPLDNLGRVQLFEALGAAQAKDGSIVVSTRTAGVWRLSKGIWKQFAQGTFDSLGLIIEDDKGLDLVVGQKAELTRITDTNGDGVADTFKTLSDQFSYHGNYHTYMHGPVKAADGNYYFALNLAHADVAVYKAEGKYMGTHAGYSGWTIQVTPEGESSLWANGLRSPASFSSAPDGSMWYADNQGEFVSTSKLFRLKSGAFYGHPSALVELPGMTPSSPEIQWPEVKAKRELAAILFPHNRLANSPGNAAWDTSKGKFGPFAGQMFIGDQTQSNLMRVTIDTVNGIEQGVAIPFADGLESGVMRPVMLKDNSMLLGQTGRGWQAKGGHVASLQRITYKKPKTIFEIKDVKASPSGFTVSLTSALKSGTNLDELKSAIQVNSWTYRDAPDYGSPELGNREEGIAKISLSKDGREIAIDLSELRKDSLHEDQTAWVYEIKLNLETLKKKNLIAYYTAYGFPNK